MGAIKRNMAKCKKCETTVESKFMHDFKWCPCRTIAVDGGHSYIRRIGDLENIEELSEEDA